MKTFISDRLNINLKCLFAERKQHDVHDVTVQSPLILGGILTWIACVVFGLSIIGSLFMIVCAVVASLIIGIDEK